MDTEFILDQMETSAEPFAVCQLHGRGDLPLGKDPMATLHYILAGRGEIIMPDAPPIEIEQGSLVLIPSLCRHTLRSFGEVQNPQPMCQPANLELAHLIHGDATEEDGQLIAICAHISLSLRSLHNLIDLVREPIIEKVDEGNLLEFPVEAILKEITEPGLGSKAMIRALLLVCTIEMMRRRLGAQDQNLSWMAALRDPKLWPSLQLMLEKPGDLHSLESLAETALMSRSAFAKRFMEAYGSGPMEFLRDIRMRQASVNLIETDLPVKKIAEMSGYQSRSAFTRAFEATTGKSPQQFRSQGKNPE